MLMKYLMILIVLPLCLSCGHAGKTAFEKYVQSKENQLVDTLKKMIMPIDERIGCNDTLGISLYPEYSVYSLATKTIRFVLCNNSKKEIRFGERSCINYQDEKGVWRKLPLPANICIPDILYIMRPGESRFISDYLYTDLQPNRVGQYRFFQEITYDGNQLTLMTEFRLTDKQEPKNIVRNIPFFVSLEPDKIDIVEKQDSIYKTVKVMPVFPGGMDKLSTFIENKIQYPQQALKNGVEGIVYIQVVIEKDGSVTDCRIFKSVDPYLDKEAIRIARSMPKWKPGKQDGVAVRTQSVFPVCFKRNDFSSENSKEKLQ